MLLNVRIADPLPFPCTNHIYMYYSTRKVCFQPKSQKSVPANNCHPTCKVHSMMQACDVFLMQCSNARIDSISIGMQGRALLPDFLPPPPTFSIGINTTPERLASLA